MFQNVIILLVHITKVLMRRSFSLFLSLSLDESLGYVSHLIIESVYSNVQAERLTRRSLNLMILENFAVVPNQPLNIIRSALAAK